MVALAEVDEHGDTPEGWEGEANGLVAVVLSPRVEPALQPAFTRVTAAPVTPRPIPRTTTRRGTGTDIFLSLQAACRAAARTERCRPFGMRPSSGTR